MSLDVSAISIQLDAASSHHLAKLLMPRRSRCHRHCAISFPIPFKWGSKREIRQ